MKKQPAKKTKDLRAKDSAGRNPAPVSPLESTSVILDPETGLDVEITPEGSMRYRLLCDTVKVNTFQIGAALMEIRDEKLYFQGGHRSLRECLEAEFPFISLSAAYGALNVAEAFDIKPGKALPKVTSLGMKKLEQLSRLTEEQMGLFKDEGYLELADGKRITEEQLKKIPRAQVTKLVQEILKKKRQAEALLKETEESHETEVKGLSKKLKKSESALQNATSKLPEDKEAFVMERFTQISEHRREIARLLGQVEPFWKDCGFRFQAECHAEAADGPSVDQ